MRLKEIVNIMPDDKFLDYYITMSEKFLPLQSSYIVFKNTKELIYIKNKTVQLIIFKESVNDFEYLLSILGDTKLIVFHSFRQCWYPFIRAIPNDITKVWLFWGSDGYAALKLNSTSSLASKLATYEDTIWGNLKFLYNYGKGFFLGKRQMETRDIIKLMDFCGTWVDADQSIAKKININIKALSFNYYTKELMNFESYNCHSINRNKLLLGNSGNPSNNHVEALKTLSEKKFSGVIYCPLSYGGSELYIKNVCSLGNKLFGSNFKPLLNFIPLDEYQTIVNECGIIWMNHKRQQAAGNLLFSFVTKKIVVLNAISPLAETFDKWNLIHYNIENFDANYDSQELDLIKNRHVILERVTIDENKSFFKSIQQLANNT
jgi:dTDP-N-acetylfucosamine:lipid II N-acetylfucosaminyltransferase